MYESTSHHDYVQTEMEYRLGRIRADIAGRRQRRLIARRRSEDWRGDAGDATYPVR